MPDADATTDRRADSRSRDLMEALGLRASAMDAHTRAAVEALSEEILSLRETVAALESRLDRAAQLADIDTLCPIFNRRAFERELRREIALAERYGAPLCVVFIDLDGFKQVNDRFGHKVGDDVLRRVADILVADTRETDIVARLGGDEFAVALTHANFEDSARKAVELSGRIDTLSVRYGDGADDAVVRLGASCGVARWERGVGVEDLLAKADHAMFLDKSLRRARVR